MNPSIKQRSHIFIKSTHYFYIRRLRADDFLFSKVLLGGAYTILVE